MKTEKPNDFVLVHFLQNSCKIRIYTLLLNDGANSYLLFSSAMLKNELLPQHVCVGVVHLILDLLSLLSVCVQIVSV